MPGRSGLKVRPRRNFGKIEDADRIVNGVNPLCGDKLTLYLKLDDDRIQDISFEGAGCAISIASSFGPAAPPVFSEP